jgi:hypothetical protein
MKKKLLIAIAGFFFLTNQSLVTAQISLNSTLPPYAGTTTITSLVTTPDYIFSKYGTGLSWDITAFTPAMVDDTTWYFDPSTTAGAAFFPTSTIAFLQSGGTDVTYLKSNSTDLKEVGVYIDPAKNGNFYPAYSTPAISVFTFPFTYPNTINNSSTVRLVAKGSDVGQPTLDSVKIVETVTKKTVVTGYGTLTTPVGVYANSIIESAVEMDVDSTLGKGPSTGGAWVSAGAPTTKTDSSYSIFNGTSLEETAKIFYNNGKANAIRYFLKSITTPTGIIPIPSVNVAFVYPNPFTNTTCFSFSSKAKSLDGFSLSIYGIDGKLVDYILSISGDKYIYNNSVLSKGVYLYRLSDGNSIVGKGKLIVE